MNRRERRTLDRKVQALGDDLVPRLNHLIATSTDDRPWLHGGAPGLKPGDLLLPRAVTGNGNGSGDHFTPGTRTLNEPADAGFVYITRAMTGAQNYATAYAGRTGTIYRVSPVGPVTVDTYMVRLAAFHSEVAELLEWQIRSGEIPLACCCESAIVAEVLAQPWLEPEDSEFHVEEDTIMDAGTVAGKYVEMTALQLLQRTESKTTTTVEPEPLPDIAGLSRQQRRQLERQYRKHGRPG